MLLFYLISLSFFGGILSWFVELINYRASRWVAITVTILLFFLSIQPLLNGNYNSLCNSNGISNWQEVFSKPWIPSLGINISFAVDGLSVLMIILTSIVGIISVLTSWDKDQEKQGFYYFNLLWLITGVIGIFISIDLFLFFFFWEMTLIPIYLLVINWGHKELEIKKRIKAIIKFFIYTQSSSLIMLLSIIGFVIIHFKTTGLLTFNYNELLGTKMSSSISFILMLGFFIAFIVKMPLVPFHGWISDIQESSPTSGSVDISGIMIKTAVYGQLRFILPLFPKVSIEFATIAMIFGLFSFFYGSFLAFKQSDIKRLVAYSSLSHMGFVTIAIYSNSILSYQGAIIYIISNTISSTGLILVSSHLYDRIQIRNIKMMGGLWKHIKWLPGLSLFFAVANFAIPGTGNFVGEFMILFGAFDKFKLVICVAAFGVIFTSLYSLWMIQQIYYGTSKLINEVKNLTILEFGVLLFLSILLLVIGFYAQLISNISIGSTKALYNFIFTL